MSKFSEVSHYLAAAAALVWGFMMTPAGQAVIKQYPHIGALVAGVTTVLAVYHNPTKQ